MDLHKQRVQHQIDKIKNNFELQKNSISKLDAQFVTLSPRSEKSNYLLNEQSELSLLNINIKQKSLNKDIVRSNHLRENDSLSDQSVGGGQFQDDDRSQMPPIVQGVDRLLNYQEFKLKDQQPSLYIKRFKTPLKQRKPPSENESSPYFHDYKLNIESARQLDASRNDLACRSKSVSLPQHQKQKKSRLLELSSHKSQSRVLKLLNYSALQSQKKKQQISASSSQEDSKALDQVPPSQQKLPDEGVMPNDYQSLPVIQFNGNMRPSLGALSQGNSASIRNNRHSSLGSSQLLSKNKKAIENNANMGSARKHEEEYYKTGKGISKKQDCFKIQRLLGDLVERNKNKTINFNEMLHISKGRSSRNKPKSVSVLTTERSPTSSIITSIKPSFPLRQGSRNQHLIEIDTQQDLKFKVADIISSGNPVQHYTNLQKMEKVLDIEQALYRQKIKDMNRVMADNYINASMTILDENYNIQKKQQESRFKSDIKKSRRISTINDLSLFHIHRWRRMSNIQDHQGKQISKSGYQMDDLDVQKEQNKKFDTARKKSKNDYSLHYSQHQTNTGQPNAVSQEKAQKQHDDDKASTHSESRSPKSIIPMAQQSKLSVYVTDEGSPNQRSLIEDPQTGVTLDKNSELTRSLSINRQKQTKHISKTERFQLQRQQIELEKQQQRKNEEELKAKKLKDDMIQEEEDYWDEWKQTKQDQMLSQVDVFLKDRKDNIAKVNEEIFALENNSDDELNIFENFASTKANIEMKQRINFKNRQITKNQKSKQMLITHHGHTQPNSGLGSIVPQLVKPGTDADLGATQINQAKHNIGFKRALEVALQKQTFAKQVQEVYNKVEDRDYDPPKKTKKTKIDSNGQEITDTESEEESEENEDNEEEQRQLELKALGENNANMSKKYVQQCRTEKVLPLPTIHKIIDGVLTLEDYKLNTGQCKALGSVLQDLEDQIYKIVLKNNGIDDKSFADIVQGALKNPHITSLIIKNNEFKRESLNQMLNYFDKSKKPVLKELVISGCKTKTSHMNELLKELSDYSYLRVLGISQNKLDKESMHFLADIANGNVMLRELDISWNEVTSLNMWSLIQNIEYCDHISYLNLSFNSFVGNYTNDIVQSLGNFVRMNKNLLHLDISYCGLRRQEVLEMVKACKKSRSLLAVHLSGNLITDEVKAQIRQLMQPRRRVKDLYDKINEPDSDDDETTKGKEGSLHISKAIQQKLQNYSAAEAIGKDKHDFSQIKGNPGERLIFSRVLGHFEIPRSQKWQESSECWICEKHAYTVLLVSKSIAKTYFVQPKLKDRQIYFDKIKNAKLKQQEVQMGTDENDFGSDDDQLYYDADTEETKNHSFKNNLLTGTFNRWKCKSFIPLGEFLKRLKKNSQPTSRLIKIQKDLYQQQVKELKEIQTQKALIRHKRKQELRKLAKIGIEQDQEESQWQDTFTDTDLNHTTSNWLRELNRILPWKEQTNFAVGLDKLQNIDMMGRKLSQMKERVYVYANYMPPGKHNSCLLFNTENMPKKNIYSFIIYVRPRQQPLPIKQKKIREYKIQRSFHKPTSMFKEWTDETPSLLRKACQKDIDYSKLGRFIRDQFEFRRVCDVLQEYTQVIKDIFCYSIAMSSFPSISWIDFCNQCANWQIQDNRTCTMQTIDRIFIAVNVDMEQLEDNPDRDLCRYEFYEIIVRMGGAKFKDAGDVQTWDQATAMIMEKCMIPNTKKMMGGQSFRDKYIWTLPIDDLFRANYNKVAKLYKSYTSTTKRFLDINDCNQLLKPFNLSEQDVAHAYAFSKIMIVDEMNQKDKYDRLLLVEFIDFLCRCAYLIFKKEENITFLEKVERVLDVLFKQLNEKREKPNFEIEVSSQSDYSSDD